VRALRGTLLPVSLMTVPVSLNYISSLLTLFYFQLLFGN